MEMRVKKKVSLASFSHFLFTAGFPSFAEYFFFFIKQKARKKNPSNESSKAKKVKVASFFKMK
jgi:hypothetical protein